MSTEAKCSCNFCNGHIAFDTVMAGQVISCPHCGLETKLYVPPPPAAAHPPAPGLSKASIAPIAGENKLNNVSVEIKHGVSPMGIASLVLGIMGCVICWIPIVGLFAIPIALIGLVLAFIGIVMAAINKKTGFVFSISGGIVCIICICIAFVTTGTVAKLYSDSKKTNQTPVPAAVESTSKKPETVSQVSHSNSDWTQSRIVKSGDVQITLIKTHLETQRSIAHDNPQFKDLVFTNGFAVELEIKNASSSKIVRGKGWSGADNVTLTDNFGNKYPQNTYRNPDPRWPSPALVEDFTLYPDKSENDFMRFDKLVANVKWLHLELPADNFGGSGMVRFEIPMSKIDIQWPPPY